MAGLSVNIAGEFGSFILQSIGWHSQTAIIHIRVNIDVMKIYRLFLVRLKNAFKSFFNNIWNFIFGISI